MARICPIRGEVCPVDGVIETAIDSSPREMMGRVRAVGSVVRVVAKTGLCEGGAAVTEIRNGVRVDCGNTKLDQMVEIYGTTREDLGLEEHLPPPEEIASYFVDA